MYKLTVNANGEQNGIIRLSDNTAIPYAHDNTDYQQFVRDIKNGVQLNDAEGNPITGTALTTFISTLP